MNAFRMLQKTNPDSIRVKMLDDDEFVANIVN